eukprot:2901220-Prymnesium_polylepis.1
MKSSCTATMPSDRAVAARTRGDAKASISITRHCASGTNGSMTKRCRITANSSATGMVKTCSCAFEKTWHQPVPWKSPPMP